MMDTPPFLIPVEESIRAALAGAPETPGSARDFYIMCLLLGVGKVVRNEIMRVLPEISEDQFAIIGEMTAQHLDGIVRGSLHSLQARVAFEEETTDTVTEEVVE